MTITRRSFIASTGAMIATGTPGLRVALAATPSTNRDIFVVLFLRGAADGLSLVAPVNDPDYIANRPTIRVRDSGTNVGLQIPNGPNGLDWRLHGTMSGMQSLYTDGKLAIVHATGVLSNSRSHFDSQDFMERGVADGEKTQTSGWLARHVATVGNAGGLLPDVAVSSSVPRSLMGDASAVAVSTPSSFALTNATTDTAIYTALTKGNSGYEQVARKTVSATQAIQSKLARDAAGRVIAYTPGTGLAYGNDGLGTGLASLAQLIKMDIGLEVATVDFGGWDHHDNLVAQMNNVARQLSSNLTTFWNDIAAYQSRVTVVAMTEFGRRFKENGSGGLDHGHGSAMFVLGGGINGGKIYGTWPGLNAAVLDETRDLAITTDYRRVLSEVLVNRTGNSNIANVFPTVPYAPLGLTKAVGV
ncbi:DUF1501 domain-containing protein [Roseiterribacter gracilis]|uniref:DUF1501 domain-containing protein n=1 Tax=Roseiterribacter gracilis TaxID=2812848 RepID=A0A8S8XGY4_9PROT|nr:hypothetical protein TMPK1_40210 [Rhodospirillales bacterium TMPK1]